jgi:TPP-dependent 2-oxoacid decarboxylase
MEERSVSATTDGETTTVGYYIADRLLDASADTFFTVAGDFILSLLDYLLKRQLHMVGCESELIAGYAADGMMPIVRSPCYCKSYKVLL